MPDLAEELADWLEGLGLADQLAAGDVTIVVGRANLAETSANTMAALHLLQQRLPAAKVLPVLRRGNVVGALQLGMRPGKGGLDSTGVLQAAAEGRIRCLVLLGSDPLADFPDSDLADRALAGEGDHPVGTLVGDQQPIARTYCQRLGVERLATPVGEREAVEQRCREGPARHRPCPRKLEQLTAIAQEKEPIPGKPGPGDAAERRRHGREGPRTIQAKLADPLSAVREGDRPHLGHR